MVKEVIDPGVGGDLLSLFLWNSHIVKLPTKHLCLYLQTGASFNFGHRYFFLKYATVKAEINNCSKAENKWLRKSVKTGWCWGCCERPSSGHDIVVVTWTNFSGGYLHKACTQSSQLKIPAWMGDDLPWLHPSLRSYWQMMDTGVGEESIFFG